MTSTTGLADETTNGDAENLRVLVADEAKDRLQRTAEIVLELGHVVVERETDVSRVGESTRRERPDVALVELDRSQAHALELITKIVEESACPVIALIDAEDPAFVREAASRGVFAYIANGELEELQSSPEIVLCRFREYREESSGAAVAGLAAKGCLCFAGATGPRFRHPNPNPSVG